MPVQGASSTAEALCNEIKQQKKKSETILLYDSSSDTKVFQKCRDFGINHKLVKPVKKEELRIALETIDKGEITEYAKPVSEFAKTEEERDFSLKGRYKVMIAEDNRINMKLAETLLAKLLPESEIIKAIDGSKAVDYFIRLKPDLVFMDIQMPEKDGYTASREIRAFESKNNDQQTPIIALTAGTVKGERERCLDAGMNDYLSKPFKETDIIHLIKRWLIREVKNGSEKDSDKKRNKLLHFDADALRKRIDNNNELFNQLIEAVNTDFPVTLASLKKAYHEKNIQYMKSNIHSLKGAARNMNFDRLAFLARKTEMEILKESEWEAINNSLKQLFNEYNSLQKILSKYL